MSEQAVIEGILVDNKVYDTIGLSEEDFEDAKCRIMYRFISDLIEQGLKVDQFALSEYAHKQKNELVKMSDVLSLQPFQAANVEYYAKQVKRSSKLRRLKRLKAVIEDGNDPDVLAHDIEMTLSGLTDSGKDMYKISDMLSKTIDQIEQAYRSHGKLTGVTSGFTQLDSFTRGFQKGDLIIIAARPSIGKTAIALNMVTSVAMSTGRVGFFSCEMSVEQISKRLLSSVGKVDLRQIESGHGSAADFSRLTDGAGKLYSSNILIDDTPNINLLELRSKARRMKRLGVDIIFVDYLTLVRHPDPRMPRHQAVGEISKNMKSLARELDVPVVALSQINREGEGQVPNLSNLRQSGEIEEDADIVMFLHRESREAEEGVLTIAKHRNGPTGEIDLSYSPRYVTFKERWSD